MRPGPFPTGLLLLIAGAASADPSFDCAKASSSDEDLICAEQGLARLDRRMADRYRDALDRAAALDAGANTTRDGLKASQRGWIKGRDDCWKADDMARCIEDSYHMREAELVAKWMLEEPAAVVAFSCEANPANEVTVYFFSTERPSIRLEYGDSIRAGWLVRAGSGSKYATPFGGFFWQKGDEPLFSWTDGQEMNCAQAG